MSLSQPLYKEQRLAFGETITELGKTNPAIVVLATDLAHSTKADLFGTAFPTRFFQCGVAEQNMAGIAAGLALAGKIPVITSFGVFSPGRNWDQIRVSVCFSQANVKIVSTHTGLSAAKDGATHQALEDIALTRVLPNMTVLAPADYEETKKAITAAINLVGPVYIRLGREATPSHTKPSDPFEIGKATVIHQGDAITLIASGACVYDALLAAKKLATHKINAEVINVHTLKPFDQETIMQSVLKTKSVLSVEEHQIIGGLGSAISEALAENAQRFGSSSWLFKRLGIRNTFTESGEYVDLKAKYNLSWEHIYTEAKKLVALKN